MPFLPLEIASLIAFATFIENWERPWGPGTTIAFTVLILLRIDPVDPPIALSVPFVEVGLRVPILESLRPSNRCPSSGQRAGVVADVSVVSDRDVVPRFELLLNGLLSAMGMMVPWIKRRRGWRIGQRMHGVKSGEPAVSVVMTTPKIDGCYPRLSHP